LPHLEKSKIYPSRKKKSNWCTLNKKRVFSASSSKPSQLSKKSSDNAVLKISWSQEKINLYFKILPENMHLDSEIKSIARCN